MSRMVVDASVAASWLFDDEDDARAAASLSALDETQGIVPQLWHYEMRNILLMAQRRKRISTSGFQERVAALDELPLETDGTADLDHALALAGAHGLSFYDALYLELACRRQASMATLDAKLITAAQAEGVIIV